MQAVTIAEGQTPIDPSPSSRRAWMGAQVNLYMIVCLPYARVIHADLPFAAGPHLDESGLR